MSGNKFPVPLSNLQVELINSINNVLKDLVNYKVVCEQEETKRHAISKRAEVEIERIRQQALLLHKIIDKGFEERKDVIEKTIKLLDHGIQTSNIEIIERALNFLCFYLKENNPVKLILNTNKIVDMIMDKENDEIIEI